jgi:hypothetical protein
MCAEPADRKGGRADDAPVSTTLRVFGADAFGLLLIAVGAVLYGPTRWSSARLLRRGRRVTATVVRIAPGGMTKPALNPGASGFRRYIPPTVRLAFSMDGHPHEKTLRLAELGAETGYTVGQRLDIYVAKRLGTRIRSSAEANAHGYTDQVLGACMGLGGLAWIIMVTVMLAA